MYHVLALHHFHFSRFSAMQITRIRTRYFDPDKLRGAKRFALCTCKVAAIDCVAETTMSSC